MVMVHKAYSLDHAAYIFYLSTVKAVKLVV